MVSFVLSLRFRPSDSVLPYRSFLQLALSCFGSLSGFATFGTCPNPLAASFFYFVPLRWLYSCAVRPVRHERFVARQTETDFGYPPSYIVVHNSPSSLLISCDRISNIRIKSPDPLAR
jgi:hypothetical protein